MPERDASAKTRCPCGYSPDPGIKPGGGCWCSDPDWMPDPVYWWADRLAPTLTVCPIRTLDQTEWRIAFGDCDAPITVTAAEAREIAQALVVAAQAVEHKERAA
jgi:hypothetical protein